MPPQFLRLLANYDGAPIVAATAQLPGSKAATRSRPFSATITAVSTTTRLPCMEIGRRDIPVALDFAKLHDAGARQLQPHTLLIIDYPASKMIKRQALKPECKDNTAATPPGQRPLRHKAQRRRCACLDALASRRRHPSGEVASLAFYSAATLW